MQKKRGECWTTAISLAFANAHFVHVCVRVKYREKVMEAEGSARNLQEEQTERDHL